MSVTVEGIPQLQARFRALTPNQKLMGRLALSAVREQKLLVPRRTGNLGRSIHIKGVTEREALTVASASYALYVEKGTRAHTIVPKTKKALRFAAAGSATLSGRVAAGGKPIFAKRVRHPGTKAHPFMVPGARKALEHAGLKNVVIDEWNSAA